MSIWVASFPTTLLIAFSGLLRIVTLMVVGVTGWQETRRGYRILALALFLVILIGFGFDLAAAVRT